MRIGTHRQVTIAYENPSDFALNVFVLARCQVWKLHRKVQEMSNLARMMGWLGATATASAAEPPPIGFQSLPTTTTSACSCVAVGTSAPPMGAQPQHHMCASAGVSKLMSFFNAPFLEAATSAASNTPQEPLVGLVKEKLRWAWGRWTVLRKRELVRRCEEARVRRGGDVLVGGGEWCEQEREAEGASERGAEEWSQWDYCFPSEDGNERAEENIANRDTQLHSPVFTGLVHVLQFLFVIECCDLIDDMCCMHVQILAQILVTN